MLKAKIGKGFDPFLGNTSRLIQRMGLGPNGLTFIGLGLNGLAAWALAEGEFLQAACLIILAGFFDILDGAMARTCNQATAFGAFLDSVLDRYSDLGLLVGLLIYYSRQGTTLYQVLVGLSIIGTAVVPYARARAETLIPKCNEGILERGERILLLFLGAAIQPILPVIVWILAIFCNVTVIQRVLYTRRALLKEKEKSAICNPQSE